MIFLIFIAYLEMICSYDVSYKDSICGCSKINYQNDCRSQISSSISCQWTNSACQITNCLSLTTFSACVVASTCAWVNNTCQTFTKCSDYLGTDNVTCSVQGFGCNYTDFQNKTSACTDFTLKSQNSTTSSCSSFTTNSTCLGTGINCVWSGTTCKLFGCSDYTSSSNCQSANSEDEQTIKICDWKATCSEASSLSVLNATNCFFLTKGRATWNQASSSCSQCSSSQLIKTGIPKFILLICMLSALFI